MITRFETPHIPAVASLEQSLFDHGLSEASLTSLYHGGAFWGFVAGDAPNAYILAHVTADEGEILSLGTRSGFQRKGLARALCDHLTKQMRAENKTALFLEVASDNDAAMALYTSLGFVKTGTRPAYYKRVNGSVDAVVMRLSL